MSVLGLGLGDGWQGNLSRTDDTESCKCGWVLMWIDKGCSEMAQKLYIFTTIEINFSIIIKRLTVECVSLVPSIYCLYCSSPQHTRRHPSFRLLADFDKISDAVLGSNPYHKALSNLPSSS